MKIKIKYIIFFVIVVSFLASYYFPGVNYDPRVENTITFVGILFGVVIGFFIKDLYTRYQEIRKNVAIDVSSLTTFFYFADLLSKGSDDSEWLEEVGMVINKYVVDFIPIPWEKYYKTDKNFVALGQTLKKIEFPDRNNNVIYLNLLRLYGEHSTARENLIIYGKDKLTFGEWLTVSFLGILFLILLFYIKDTSVISSIFTGAITSSILMLFIILRDLNNLNFGENNISIEPYEEVLDYIGKPRYFKTKRRSVI